MFKQFTLLILFIAILHSSNSDGLNLRGCYVESEQYIYRNPESRDLEGYCIDVINKVAEIAGFEYQMYMAPDGKHGRQRDNGMWTGIIGEVVRQVADFAISDLTVTPQRKMVVDFTEPIMNLSIAALISKKHKGSIESFRDLEEQTSVKYGIFNGGSTMLLFQSTSDPTFRDMHNYMSIHPEVYVRSNHEGINRVKQEKFAFIGESSTIEYYADNDCDLAVIRGDEFDGTMRRQYAIALQKGSRYKEKFNDAIRKLRDDGTLQQLKQKYWNKECLSSSSNSLKTHYFHTFLTSFIIIFLALVKC